MSRVLNFCVSLRLIVGKNSLSRLPEIVRGLGAALVAVLTDDVVYGIIGREVEQALQDAGVEAHVHLVGPATREEFEKAREFLAEVGAPVAVGLGGGRVVDAAKYASYKCGAVFISAPTAVSHDGIASPTVSFKDEEGKPVSLKARPPSIVVADTRVISRAPRRLLASGFADIIGKFTSVRDAQLALLLRGEPVNPYALELAETALRIAVKNVDKIARFDPAGVEALVLAAATSGLAAIVDGSSRPISGSEHLFSHALDLVCPEKKSLHGEQVGVGTIMMARLHGIDWRRVRRLLLKVGAPVDAEGLGVPPDAIIEALTIAHKVRKRYTILGTEGLTREAAKRLAEETLVV